MTELNIEIPKKLHCIFNTDKRYIVIYGGRGSGKSWSIADFLLIKGYQKQKRILCTREIQNTIKDSVHKLLSDKIEKHGLSGFYTIKNDSIIGLNGTEIIFKGLLRNPQDIKSMEGIDYCWVEEAHSVSRKSLEVLTPTIRKENSQIIFTYNPTNESDPVHTDYTIADRPDTLKIEINYSDNKGFPIVLKNEMEYDRAHDIDKYYHIWEGRCVQHSEAQIFYGKWIIEDFEKYDQFGNMNFPDRNTFYYFGSDFGYSADPSTLNRCFIVDNNLYIDYEYHGLKIDIDRLPECYSSIPESKNYPIIGDSSRNDTINYIKQRGFPLIQGAEKGKGSIEDGIAFMRSFDKIILHPRCKHTIDEFRLYSYVTDPKTGLISTKIEDKNNHHIDSLRYALERLMKHTTGEVGITIGW